MSELTIKIFLDTSLKACKVGIIIPHSTDKENEATQLESGGAGIRTRALTAKVCAFSVCQ